MRYNKICNEQSIYDFDVHLRNVQMLRELEPAAFEASRVKSRFFFYDYGNFYHKPFHEGRMSLLGLPFSVMGLGGAHSDFF